METEYMIDGEGKAHCVNVQGKQTSKRSKVWNLNVFRMSVGCLGLALFAAIVAVGLFKTVPNFRRSIYNNERSDDMADVAVKVIFTTNRRIETNNQPPNIKDFNNIENQMNAKLGEQKIRVNAVSFSTESQSNGMTCRKPLNTYLLHMSISPFDKRNCIAHGKDTCKNQIEQQLKTLFSTEPVMSLTIHLSDNQVKSINIRLCSLSKTTAYGQGSDSIATTAPEKTVAKAPYELAHKLGRNIPVVPDSQNRPWLASRCALCLNKIGLVEINGEFGTRIHDDLRTFGNRNQQRHSVKLYEGGSYNLQVQLDCHGSSGGNNGYSSPCSTSLTVKIRIDYNDNQYDDEEIQTLLQTWRSEETSTGRYALDIYIPYIDGRTIKSGPHRAVIIVTPSEEYQLDCGTIDYKETREYSFDIVPKAAFVAPTVPYRDPICSTNFAKIILVLMAGEKGTEIRDDKPAMRLTSNYRNPHHVGVTLFEHTIYLIRIQLDCSTQLRTDLTVTGCNLAQDVFVWIDLNDDGRFDDSEVGTPYRWPVTSYLPEGIYDLQIYVPQISARNIRNGPHRMRLVVLPSEYYQRTCGYNAYNETREYVVNIISKDRYFAPMDVSDPNLSIDEINCAPEVGRVILVVMAGEHRTQIRDDSTNHALSNRRERSIILYEGTMYLLRLQLECSIQTAGIYYLNNCTLPYDINISIDLNNDGRFDDSEVATPYRWPISSYLPKGVYDLQLYVPNIDGRIVTSGTHRMRIVVMLNSQYRNRCGNREYQEVREYNVTIVRMNQPIGEIEVPYRRLNDYVCSQKNAQIALVIVTGEKGTHIRDDTPLNTIISENQNRHHMAVSLYENQKYRVRIQLECYQDSRKESYINNCNLAQDVNVLIDFNNDGRFSDAESRVPNRWPLRSSMPLGIYDYEIYIPSIGEQNIRGGSYTMRIVVMPSDEYRQKCGHTDYREMRDYTVNIISKEAYPDNW